MHSISFPSVFYIEDVVSSQLVVVFPWFGNISQEAVCPVLRYVEDFLIDSVIIINNK